MDQVRLLVRQLEIEGLAGVVVRHRGRVLLLCEALMNEDEQSRADVCNELLARLDSAPSSPVSSAPPLRAVS